MTDQHDLETYGHDKSVDSGASFYGEDTGDATFFREDKAILFMRYIRKFLEDSEKQTT